MHHLIAWIVVATALAGCHHRGRSHVAGGVLGRVVIYRNGVAFYERTATVADGRLTVQVPRERVDDFLKSLTVVDRESRKPLAVTIPRKQADDASYLTMTLETPEARNAQVLLTYVTEAPAWKPSYRVVVGKDGKVMLEGWAIVDNTTSEDWNGVLVGVGASSALAFRYDLWSVRQIDRDLLQGEDRFAIAPPTGVSPYGGGGDSGEELASLDGSELRGDARGDRAGALSGTTAAENTYIVEGMNTTSAPATAATGALRGTLVDKASGEKLVGVTVVATSPALVGEQVVISDEHGAYQIDMLPPGNYTLTLYYADATTQRKNIIVAAGKATQVSARLDPGSISRGEVIEITASAPLIDQSSTKVSGVMVTDEYIRHTPTNRSLGAAAGAQSDSADPPKPPPPVKRGDDKLRAIVDKLTRDRRDVLIEVHGAPGSEAQATARGAAVKHKLIDDGVPAGRIRIVHRLGPGEPDTVRVLAIAPSARPDPSAPPAAGGRGAGGDAPVGESHFWAEQPMTVRSGTSAMVAMVHGETTGGIVYLYDPISDRGDRRFAFKAVRLDNPTDDTLEPGPVTVYGDGRFIGEGITEPVPPNAPVVVPFALDKQVVIERDTSEHDRIAKLITVQRGVITAEVQHRRLTSFSLTSRLPGPTVVYLRHRVEPGWTVVSAPSRPTRAGDAQLFQVELPPGATREVRIDEATPMQRSFEVASPEALGMLQVFIAEPEASPQLRAQIDALLDSHRATADLISRIETLRDQLAEYRSRSGELHAQLVTLRAVRTGGELMTALRAKLAEMSERVQKTTIELVTAQERLMLARVKFQNQLAELELTDATRAADKR